MQNPMILMFVLYILTMLLIGWLGYYSTSNLSDYILGGRRLGKVVTALAAGASDMSGWLLMGLPGLIYLSGLSGAWIAIGLVTGAWCNWKFVALRLRLFTEKFGNALTIPEYLSNRFEDKKHYLRISAAAIILIFFTIYCSSGVVASARLFQNVFNIEYETAIYIGTFATIAYVFIGGFLAVSWTDTIQASLIITALIFTPLVMIYHNGGVTQSLNIIQEMKPAHSSLFANLTIIEALSLVAWGLGYFGQPHILVRFMATSKPKNIPGSRRISITWMIFCLLGAIAVGYFGIAYFALHPDIAAPVNNNPENVFIETAKYLFNPWIAGFLLAAILAAIMSTLSCQLLMCSSALTEDLYKTFFRKNASQKELVYIGRLMVFVVACIAILMAKNPNNGVLDLVSYAWAGFGDAFGPLIIFSLLWSRMTEKGALAGLIVGAVTVLIWRQYTWFGIYEIIPGFILASIAIVAVSLLTRPPSASVVQKFNEAKSQIIET
jgi:sodium/proline symporter